MANLVCLEEPHWFVLNHIGIAFQDMAKRAVDRFNSQHMCALELFSPTYVVREEKMVKLKCEQPILHITMFLSEEISRM